jgi:hypothetical protein
MKTGRLEQLQTKEEVELMMRKKGWLAALLVLCLLLVGCGNSSANIASEADRRQRTVPFLLCQAPESCFIRLSGN